MENIRRPESMQRIDSPELAKPMVGATARGRIHPLGAGYLPPHLCQLSCGTFQEPAPASAGNGAQHPHPAPQPVSEPTQNDVRKGILGVKYLHSTRR